MSDSLTDGVLSDKLYFLKNANYSAFCCLIRAIR